MVAYCLYRVLMTTSRAMTARNRLPGEFDDFFEFVGMETPPWYQED